MIWDVARWTLGFVLLWRLPRPPRPAGPPRVAGRAPVVSVVVPARNEEDNLGRLLPTLAGQAVVEVIVVDDGSTDATAEVARTHGATVVSPGEPPEGWLGKPWACAAGAAAARGDVLVFLDADVTCDEPDAIAAVVDAQRARGGLVSVQPWHDARKPHEKLALFPNLVALMTIGPFSFAGDAIEPRGAFGPCLAIDRDAYERAGTHAAVRDRVVEDIALAHLVAAHDRVTLFAGRGPLSFRMYPGGIGDVVEGFSKNLAVGASAASRSLVLLMIPWAIGALTAPLVSPWLYAAYAAQLWYLGRRIGRFGPVTAALYPIGFVFFTVLVLLSLYKTYVRRSVTWRGRTWAISSRGR